jgi:FAD:protein FMN transferase
VSAPVTVPARELPRRAWVEEVMGIPVSIHVRGEGVSGPGVEQAVAAAYDVLRTMDRIFSTWQEDSEVMRLRRGEITLADCDPLVAESLRLGSEAGRLTGGAFTTVLPAGNGELVFDPTGLVKGWAVQRAADHLGAGLGCDVAVNAGGDVAAHRGTRAVAPWRVGVEDPADPTRVLAVLPLVTGGVATSGTARRGRHLTDPRTGSAATDLASVTVTGPSLLWADVLATAAFVAGEGALDLVAGVPGYQALVVALDGAVSQTDDLVRLR